tara:strand:- start:90 stop:602 length:513 start_codon:yes stop_codon:yes gene_type:complete
LGVAAGGEDVGGRAVGGGGVARWPRSWRAPTAWAAGSGVAAGGEDVGGRAAGGGGECAAQNEQTVHLHSLQCVFAYTARQNSSQRAGAHTAPLQDRCAGEDWFAAGDGPWPRMAERRALIEWGRGPYAWRSRSSLESSSGRGRSCVRCVSSVLQKVKNAQTLWREGAAVM